MEKHFEIIRQHRKICLQILKQTTRESLLKIPEGFRNNIWWNMAHAMVTHQLLLYGRTNLPFEIDAALVDKYRKGTAPGEPPSDKEIEEVAGLMMSTVEKAEEDYRKGIFKDFEPYTTSTGVTLGAIEDSIAYNAYHEGLHLGVIMSIKKLV